LSNSTINFSSVVWVNEELNTLEWVTIDGVLVTTTTRVTTSTTTTGTSTLNNTTPVVVFNTPVTITILVYNIRGRSTTWVT